MVVARMHTKNSRVPLLLYLARAYPVQALKNTVRTVVTMETVAVFRKYWAKSTRSQASTKPWNVHSRGIMDSG